MSVTQAPLSKGTVEHDRELNDRASNFYCIDNDFPVILQSAGSQVQADL